MSDERNNIPNTAAKGAADVLIVEDNQNDAMLTIRSLQKNNLANSCIHLADGSAAVDYLLAKGAYSERDPMSIPKVVLLDLKLPKLNGLEVLSLIRKNPPTKALPVVILTSSQEDRDLVASYNLGANSYIVKPVEFEKFSKAVAEVGLYWLMLNKPVTPTKNR